MVGLGALYAPSSVIGNPGLHIERSASELAGFGSDPATLRSDRDDFGLGDESNVGASAT